MHRPFTFEIEVDLSTQEPTGRSKGVERGLHFWHAFVKQYWLWYVFGLACLAGTTALTVAIPDFVRYAVDALEQRGPDGQGEAVNWAIAILVAGVSIIIVRTLSRTLFFNPGRAIEYQVKNHLFATLLTRPKRYFDRVRPGDIISRGTNDTNSVRGLVGFATLQLFNVAFTLSFTLGRMFWMDAELALWCVVPLVLAAYILRRAVKAMFSLTGLFQQQLSVLSARILETYTGVGVLQSFNAVPGALARFDEANNRLLELSLKLVTIRSWLLPVVSVMGNVCVVLVLYIGGRRVGAPAGSELAPLTLGELTAFTVFITILVNGLTSLGWLVNAAQRGWIALERVYEVMQAAESRLQPTGALPPRAAEQPGRGIEVTGLTFEHPVPHEGAKDEVERGPVLQDVSFTIKPGETLGIFGLTGAGKTTLLNILSRVYEPPRGTVKLDGVDILDIPVEQYWQAMAYVTQEPFLFSRTLRENVALAQTPEDIDDDRLQHAIEDAALAGDIKALTEGLQTRVGERGITLSGGQRQRTALARAFYRDYEVLLLDDVLSAVDHATEKKLIEAIYRRAAGGTTVLVSHRISALAQADRVLVLEEGRVVTCATHEALIADESSEYAQAWALQQAAEESARAGAA
ncbi:MAG: ABC transporter ATP-binding protein [Bradymonadia bacterium]